MAPDGLARGAVRRAEEVAGALRAGSIAVPIQAMLRMRLLGPRRVAACRWTPGKPRQRTPLHLPWTSPLCSKPTPAALTKRF